MVAECDSNIGNISMERDPNSALSRVELELHVRDRTHLARIIRRLRVSLVASKISRAK